MNESSGDDEKEIVDAARATLPSCIVLLEEERAVCVLDLYRIIGRVNSPAIPSFKMTSGYSHVIKSLYS